MTSLVRFCLIIMWVAGVVLASGWWKAVAIFIPFYSWYLVVKMVMHMYGLI